MAIEQTLFQFHPHLIPTFLLLKEGYTQKEIAKKLCLKNPDVKNRMTEIAEIAVRVTEE